MTDRELLELAARAAGYKLSPMKRRVGHRDEPILLTGFGLLTDDGRDWLNWPEFWNPLTDDGDALRLAVKLGMLIEVVSCAYVNVMTDSVNVTEHTGNDLSGCIYAATRRAIVHAAAEIGNGME